LLLAVALAVQPWSVLAAVLLAVSERGVAKAMAWVNRNLGASSRSDAAQV